MVSTDGNGAKIGGEDVDLDDYNHNKIRFIRNSYNMKVELFFRLLALDHMERSVGVPGI